MQIIVRDNNVDQALRALKKKLQREGVYREMKLRRHYEKPSEKRARERAAAIRRSRKLDRKRAEIATLKAVGAEGGLIFRVYFLQVMAIALVAVAAGLALGAALPILALLGAGCLFGSGSPQPSVSRTPGAASSAAAPRPGPPWACGPASQSGQRSAPGRSASS